MYFPCPSEPAALGPPHRSETSKIFAASPSAVCPRPVFDYLDGGADDENHAARKSPRLSTTSSFARANAVAFDKCDLSVRVLGLDLAFPGLLAPVGYSRLMHPGGEVAAAKAAGDAGTGYILSTISGHKTGKRKKPPPKAPRGISSISWVGRAAAEKRLSTAPRRAGFSRAGHHCGHAPSPECANAIHATAMKQLLGSSLFAKLPFFPQFLAHPSPAGSPAFSRRRRNSQARKHHCFPGEGPHATGGRRGRPR